MKNRFGKILAVFALVILLAVAGLVTWVFMHQNQIKQYAIRQLNAYLKVPIQVQSVEMNLIGNFPKVSIDFNEVVMNDPIQPNKQLLACKHIYLGFNVFDIIRQQYRFKLIKLEDGELNIYFDEQGKSNLDIVKTDSSAQEDKQPFGLYLNEIVFQNVDINYQNKQQQQHIIFTAHQGKLSGSIYNSSEELDFNCNLLMQQLQSGGINYIKNKKLKLDAAIAVNQTNQLLTIARANIELGLLKLKTQGTVNWSKTNTRYNIQFTGDNPDINALMAMLPGNEKIIPEDFISSGQIHFTGKINGASGANVQPNISFTFGINQGSLEHTASGLKANNIKLNGLFDNGKSINGKDARLNIDNLSFVLNEQTFNGYLRLTNLNEPQLDAAVKGKLTAATINQLLKKQGVNIQQGWLDADVMYKGKVSALKNMSQLSQGQSKGAITFEFSGIHYNNNQPDMDWAKGSFQLSGNDLNMNQLALKLKDSDIKLSGSFNNIIPFLVLKDEPLTANITYYSSLLNVKSFYIPVTNTQEESSSKTGFELPKNVIIRADVKTDKLVYNQFEATELTANINWEGNTIKVSQLQCKSQEGNISLSGSIEQAADKRFLITAKSNLDKINIQRLFTVCNNFGQTEITDKNLSGTLTGQIELISVWSEALVCDLNKLYVSANVKISSGQLVHYKPLESLS
ncbi:MAG: AsmA family protein, partial [Bacteroidota bacterium]